MTEYIIGSASIETIEKDESSATVRITPNMQEVVRCRDCKYFDTDWESETHPGRWWCDESWNYRKPGGFCAWGERRGA